MDLKFFLLIASTVTINMLFGFFFPIPKKTEHPIDQIWWDNLSDEWKTIFKINQNLSKHGVNIFGIQKEYINRLHSHGEDSLSAMNTSLYDLANEERFSLGLPSLYIRAIRNNYVIHNDAVDLQTLADLDTIYLVNGPGDLSPLSRLTNLQVLIINDCGIGYNVPINKQLLDLSPLKNLEKLRVLHCSSSALKSLEPIKNLTSLEELVCDRSGITSLDPLKKLTKLRKLSIGSKVENADVLANFTELEELYLSGSKPPVRSIGKLKKLKKLLLTEGDLSLVNDSYRYKNLDFLENLGALEYLDINNTSYRGDLKSLGGLQKLKAVTLSAVKPSEVTDLKNINKTCRIINAFEFER
jgi:hypothetical protein